MCLPSVSFLFPPPLVYIFSQVSARYSFFGNTGCYSHHVNPTKPGPDALFSLVAYEGNMEAHEIIQSNLHLVSIIPMKGNPVYSDGLERGITISFGMSRKPNGNVLASIGRYKTMVEIATPTPTKEDPQ